MQECTSFETAADYMPPSVKRAMRSVTPAERASVTEIRLYSGRAAAMIFPDRIMYLTTHGLSASFRNTAAVVVTPEEIAAVVESLSHFSVHSCQREFRQGYFMLRGGMRVGLSGGYSSDGIITQVTGLNFRISRNVTGCADELYKLTGGGGILICGGVNSGKTTILRDLCRLTGNRRKVALVDERSEVAFARNGEIMNDVGALTDVLTGCTRSEGITTAVRTLSPDYIFCDEISTPEDSRAILESIGCGVRFCATIHGDDYSGLMERKIFRELADSGAFSALAILEGAETPGKVKEIRGLRDDA